MGELKNYVSRRKVLGASLTSAGVAASLALTAYPAFARNAPAPLEIPQQNASAPLEILQQNAPAPLETMQTNTPAPLEIPQQNASASLPVEQIEAIVGASGMIQNGVLSIELDRSDLNVTGPGGIPFRSAFEINGTLAFQPLDDGQTLLVSDFPLLPEETNPFIDQLFANGLVFMAFHQHFFDLNPMVFFIHFRGVGDPLQLAKAARAALNATAIPLPQAISSNPLTSLPKDELANILGGTATVGGNGVVNVTIPRAETIYLAGIPAKPETGIAVTVAFEPLDGNGAQAAVAPDLAMIASEVNPALQMMRSQGFTVHCLYNQETDEQPPLFYSHNLATGDAIDLAQRLRNALDLMNLKRPDPPGSVFGNG